MNKLTCLRIILVLALVLGLHQKYKVCLQSTLTTNMILVIAIYVRTHYLLSHLNKIKHCNYVLVRFTLMLATQYIFLHNTHSNESVKD